MNAANPASTATDGGDKSGADEIDSAEEEISEMLATFEEVKENSTDLKSPSDVEDKIPYYAHVDENGKLWTRDTVSNEGNRSGFTDKRRRIIKEFARSGDVEEVDEKLDSSESYIRAVLREWKFVLEDPDLFEAFVLDPSDEEWKVVGDDGEHIVGSEDAAYEMARRHFIQEGEAFDIVSPDGEVKDPFDMPPTKWAASEQPSGNTVEKLEQQLGTSSDGGAQTIQERPNKGEETQEEEVEEETVDTEKDPEPEAEDKRVSFETEHQGVFLDVEEAKEAIEALYKDENRELAGDIIDRLP